MQARSRPLIIAHRGASGYLPEHTLASKALAYGMGADFLEQDVVVTADGEAIVCHDLVLDFTTDVRTQFPDRARDDGFCYALDFTLAEISQLRVSERRGKDLSTPRWPNRFPVGTGQFRVTTLADELAFIKALNRQTGRTVGACIEIKKPRWHRQQGVDLSQLVLQCLEQAGLGAERDTVFLQCFDFEEVQRLRKDFATPLPIIQLLRRPNVADAESDFEWLCSEAGLAELNRYADGIGPEYGQLVEQTGGSAAWKPSPLFLQARALGLWIQPYTFRADDLPSNVGSFDELLKLFLSDLPVDGILCDFPDRAVRIRDGLLAPGDREA